MTKKQHFAQRDKREWDQRSNTPSVQPSVQPSERAVLFVRKGTKFGRVETTQNKATIRLHNMKEDINMPRKGENIYKRKDGRWEARYIKAYTPEGTARYGYCYARTYRDVKDKLSKVKVRQILNVPEPTSHSRKKLEDVCNEWRQLNRNKLKESTYVKYTTAIEKHITPHLGKCMLAALSSELIEEFSYQLLNREKLSPKTVKDILVLLKSILSFAAKKYPGLMQPIDIVFPKIPKKEVRVLSKEEQVRFVRFLLSEMDECKFGVFLALLTGMRIGEICALKWENIFLKEGYIKISFTMQRLKNVDSGQGGKTKVTISDPKTDNAVRVIPLTDYALKLCKDWERQNPDVYVLTGMSGRYMEPRTLQYRLKQYTKACSLKEVHFHTLRHTFATRCVEAGFEIKSLSEILGHSSPQVTLERYVHSSLELKRENMKKVDVFFS